MKGPSGPRSVRRRLAAAFVFFGAGCVGLGLLIAYFGAVLSHRSDLDRVVQERATELRTLHEAEGHEGLVREILALGGIAENSLWLYAYWNAETGEVWAGNSEPPPGALEAAGPTSYWLEDRHFRGVTHLLPRGNLVAVARDITRQSSFENRIVIASLLAAIVVIVLSSVAALRVSGNLLGRVEEMSRTILAILRGNRSTRMPFRRPGDEFDELSRRFNELLDENERLVSRVREVTNNIAHDLRTPLAHVRRHLEGALARQRSADRDEETFQVTLSETNGLLATFQSLLSIARIESGVVRDEMSIVDLTQVARDAADLYEPAAEEAKRRLVLELTPDVRVWGNRHLLSQALSNLIDNAMKFSPEAGSIELSVRQTATGAELRVADHGPGIPAEARERVLERFTRLDASREEPGTGLGLSLVSAVVALHGAKLRLSDNEPGLAVTIAFRPPVGSARERFVQGLP